MSRNQPKWRAGEVPPKRMIASFFNKTGHVVTVALKNYRTKACLASSEWNALTKINLSRWRCRVSARNYSYYGQSMERSLSDFESPVSQG
ncbi:hypothetical protein EVAR_13745_1 [Eumeta japonica]|uniref:Uncharacterized protein n=1 Tax=Eumeta variegata TaxID=151549 RepID=A0A4C1UCD4_EUMVA|nr:hypothetical protein EVAR_13745_1 [Eumeta japonica]